MSDTRFNLSPRIQQKFIGLVLIFLTVLVFSPVRHHEFINFDDDIYVYANPHMEGGLTWKSVKWALSADLLYDSPHADFWIPLTFLSHLLTVELFGMDPSGHHLVNLIFHVLNTVLLFWVLQRMTGALWASGFVAGLFGVHPLHVESVAWVTERKDVLSTLFWFLTLWAYLRYVDRPTGFRYVWVVAGLVLGLLTKPMLMTLPFVLLLLDYWPLRRVEWGDRGRIRGLIREKVALFVVAGLSIMVTYVALEGGGHVQSIEGLSLWTRTENALVSTVTYMGKMLWPSELAVLYPHPGDSIPVWKVWGAVLLLGGITVWVVWGMRRWPYLAVGWFWYVGTLVPTLGLVQAGPQSMADRYTYVPLIGLFIMVGWGMGDLSRSWPYRRVLLGGAAGLVLSALTVCTGYQVQHWRDSISLFEYAIKVTENNYLIYNNLGVALAANGKFEEAVFHYGKALEIKPDYAEAYSNLGAALASQGKLGEAVAQFFRALDMDSDIAEVHNNLGKILSDQGKVEEAIAHFNRALTIYPDYAEAANHLGLVYYRSGHMEEAIREYQRALRIRPGYAMARANLGNAYFQSGRFKDAIREYQEALDIYPDYFNVHHNLGITFASQGRLEEAIAHFSKALALNPDHVTVRNQLGLAYMRRGRFEEAVEAFETVLKANPNFSEARVNLESAQRSRELQMSGKQK